MLSRKKNQLNREELVSEVNSRLKTSAKFKDKVDLELVDAIIVTTMGVIQEATMKSKLAVVMRPWGKFILKSRKARTYTDPFGNKVSKPGREVMSWQPFRESSQEVTSRLAKEKPDDSQPKDVA